MKKILKNISILALLITAFSCTKDDTLIDSILNEGTTSGGFLRTLTINGTTVTTGINFSSASFTYGADTAPFTLLLEAQDEQKGSALEKIEAYLSFKNNSVAAPKETTPILWKTYNAADLTTGPVGLPTLSFATTLGQVRTGLGITPTQYSGGDQFFITFKYVMKDGRVFTNTNSNNNVVGGVYMRSPFKYTLNVVCPITESLAGTHSYVSTNMKRGNGASGSACTTSSTTGTVTWTNTATAGTYSTTDLGFGQFASCWADNPATAAGAGVRWFCDKLVAVGKDQYGDSYTYTKVSCVGSVMTIDWVNTYFDSGRVVITRQGGAAWPAIFQN